MRVLRIVDEGNFALELHPYVSVVTGATLEQRDRIRSSLVAAARGQTIGLSGLIEAHDVIMDLDESYLGLLDLGGVDIDIVVTSNDLPGSSNTGVARQLQGAEERLRDTEATLRRAAEAADAADEALVAAEAGAVEARARAERAADAASTGESRLATLRDQLAELRAAVDSHDPAIAAAEEPLRKALEARVAVEAEYEAAEAGVRSATQRVRAAEAAVADARSRRDPFAAAARDTAALGLSEVVAEVEAERDADARARFLDGSDDTESPSDALARLEAEEERLNTRIGTSAAFDPADVRVALEVYQRGDDSSQLVASPEALGLAEQLDQIERQLASAASGASDAPTPSERAAAQEAVVAAQEELFAAERSSSRPQLDDADVRALEDAHAAVLAAQDRVEGRFGGGSRAERRVEEAREHEAEILKRMNFGTYADYMMGTSILHVDINQAGRVEEAREVLVQAESRLREIEGRLDHELELATLVSRRQSLRARARTLVGTEVSDGGLITALQELKVAEDDAFNPLGELQKALEGVGLAVSADLFESSEIIDLAEHWLTEYYATEASREQAHDRLSALRAEKAAVESRLAEEEVRAAAPDPEIERVLRLTAAREQLEAADHRIAAHDRAEADLVDALADLEHAKTAVATARESVGLTTERRRNADVEVATAEAELAERRAARSTVAARVEGIEADLTALEAELADAEHVDFDDAISIADSDVLRAEATRSATQAALTSASSAHRGASDEVAALRTAITELDGSAPPADEIEWYLLARLAGQRHVSFAGSIPLLLLDALTDVRPEDLEHLMVRLERMAGAVQVIHITDDPVIVGWAREAGEARVAVVSPLQPRQPAAV